MRPLLLIALLAGFSVAAEARAPQIKAEYCPGAYYELDLSYNVLDRHSRVTLKDETVAVRATTINRLYVKGVDCSTGDKVKIPREHIRHSRGVEARVTG